MHNPEIIINKIRRRLCDTPILEYPKDLKTEEIQKYYLLSMDRLIDIHDIVCTNGGGGGSPENVHKICAAAACKEGEEKRNGCTCSANRNPEPSATRRVFGAGRRYKRRFFDDKYKIDRSLIPNLSYFDKVNIIQNLLCSTQFQPNYLKPKSYISLMQGYLDYMALLYQVHDIVCQGAYGAENWKRISISERKLAEQKWIKKNTIINYVKKKGITDNPENYYNALNEAQVEKLTRYIHQQGPKK